MQSDSRKERGNRLAQVAKNLRCWHEFRIHYDPGPKRCCGDSVRILFLSLMSQLSLFWFHSLKAVPLWWQAISVSFNL